jgi:hypothetical protein
VEEPYFTDRVLMTLGLKLLGFYLLVVGFISLTRYGALLVLITASGQPGAEQIGVAVIEPLLQFSIGLLIALAAGLTARLLIPLERPLATLTQGPTAGWYEFVIAMIALGLLALRLPQQYFAYKTAFHSTVFVTWPVDLDEHQIGLLITSATVVLLLLMKRRLSAFLCAAHRDLP